MALRKKAPKIMKPVLPARPPIARRPKPIKPGRRPAGPAPALLLLAAVPAIKNKRKKTAAEPGKAPAEQPPADS
ncbi:MAG: hypothetical protein IJJ25_07605 [Lachnospiraceae bacterium]|nr:hypothetical protein [Lachnospiraceae bacterium]